MVRIFSKLIITAAVGLALVASGIAAAQAVGLMSGPVAPRQMAYDWAPRIASLALRQPLFDNPFRTRAMPDITTVAMLNGGPILLARVAPMAPVEPRGSQGLLGGSGNYNVFKSVAISAGNLPTLAKWRQATKGDYTPLFGANCAASGLANCDTAFAKRLQAAALRAGGMTDADVLSLVNREVNAAMRYQTDRSTWGQTDYWANPVEMAGKGAGDCEDFALAKMWMLRSLGFSPSQLQLIVLEDTNKGVFHAVLAAHLNGEAYVLDNLSTVVKSDTALANYMPIMSFVGGKSYIHGFTSQRPAMASLPMDLNSVMPGEGV
ncbi:MAG: hypothetical protein JWN11_2366 [Hyphomicrobiales bacterium]|nr:hypothetical protein [Hyphomicrobiales bacterium]